MLEQVTDSEPSVPVQRGELRRIARPFAPYRGRLAAVLALIAVSAGLGMASPFLLREVLDVAIPQADTALLTWLVAGMIAISVIAGSKSRITPSSTYSSATTGTSWTTTRASWRRNQVRAVTSCSTHPRFRSGRPAPKA